MNRLKEFLIEDGELLCYLGEASDIVIPEGVQRIKDGFFIENTNLRSVTFLTWRKSHTVKTI